MLCGLLMAQATPAMATSGDRRIVYMNGLDGHAISIKADGTGRFDYGQGFAPKLSPDGAKIAFARDGTEPGRWDLYVADVDGANLRKVSEHVHTLGGPTFFTWSPDSTRLAFTTEYGTVLPDTGGEFKQIAVVGADGTGQVQLTHDDAGVRNTNPVWSPDGTRIMYTRTLTGSDVFMMNADGSNQHVVVAGATDGSWSPDGTKVLISESGVGRRVANIDGTNRVTLAVVTDSARWSPDGSRIVIEGPECDCSMTPSDIITVNPDGTGKTVIARPPTAGGVGHPVWSPDSSKVLFTEFARYEPGRLVVAPVNGGDKTVLIIESAGFPEWAHAGYTPPAEPPQPQPEPQSHAWHVDVHIQAVIEAYLRLEYNFDWQSIIKVWR
jgi:Tol biopolymer transport system component